MMAVLLPMGGGGGGSGSFLLPVQSLYTTGWNTTIIINTLFTGKVVT